MAYRYLQTLTDEGLWTLLKEIELILNCRPLTRVGPGLDDLKTFLPIMLLTGCTDSGFPPDIFLSADGLRLSWRACQFQSDTFWKRWRSEYLPLIQRRQLCMLERDV